MKLKRQVVMLPTNNKSNLFLNEKTNFLGIEEFRIHPDWEEQHLYITSDEEIKEGDWVIPNDKEWANRPWKYIPAPCPMPYWGCADNCKKIIATTDKSLGLPSPSPAFIQAYIKAYNAGKPITEVMVEYEEDYSIPCAIAAIDCEKFQSDIGDCKGCHHCALKLKVDSNNCITITKVKDNWTREELDVILNDFASAAITAALHGTLPSDAKHFTKTWIDKNL